MKFYNGKVICVKKGYKNSIPCGDFTIGAVYTVRDGKITDDKGWEGSINHTSLEMLCIGKGHTFVPTEE